MGKTKPPDKICLLEESSTTNQQPKPNTDTKTDATAKSAGRRRIRAAPSS